ncbi:DegV family protein [Levilactobacillus tangyuanensis]|uniref:DegV family protein n=1 Tax=Levilactobacillus tangyuanensis TaxID=2486021 RepID=A0ABW1TL57_9LACO|nr:DegV family protein [Levilactobacillus tangyuanensis]
MSTAIVTDTAAYLTPTQIAQYHITVLPITVILGEHQYPESELEEQPQMFYDYLRTNPDLPTTSQTSLGEVKEAYDKLADQGVDEIISIHLSSGITSFMDNLQIFAKDYSRAKVYPIDSLVASAGEANLCLLAGQMVANGDHADTIVPELESLRTTMQVYFAVNSLSHLARTGRLSNRSAIIGDLFNIKPILTFNPTGEIIAIDKERTMKKAFRLMVDHLKTTLQSVDYPILVTVIAANNPELADQWVAKIAADFPEVRVVFSELGPVISVHTGEKTMGLIWQRDWRSV